MRTTQLEINVNKFKKNINNIRKYVNNKELMPIIKANGYGTHINKNIDVVNEFNIVAVAIVDEAIDLRNLGYKKEIFVLNQPYETEIDDIIKYDVTIGISSNEFLNKLLKVKNKVKVHLEIETGMNRTGININDLEEYINKIKKNPNIIIEGIYSHLSSADYDKDYTVKQFDTFKKALDIVKSKVDTLKYIHIEASNGLINYNSDITNLVRPGLIMYGYPSFDKLYDKIDVEPIAKLKTKITFIKEIDANESVSYSRRFISDKKMKVATIPIGYADGLRRELTNIGEVVINGQKARIIGSVCMDSCMIDVTNIKDVNVGTDVYIWDNDLVTLDDIANKCNTISYEIISGISDRVPRVFIK